MYTVEQITQMKRQEAYEASCQNLGYNIMSISDFARFPPNQQQKAFSEHIVQTVIEALNEKHVFDWNNYDEYKYYPWWDMETYGDAVPGSGFVLFGVHFVSSYTDVGARLVLKTRELAQWMADNFLIDYMNFIKQ